MISCFTPRDKLYNSKCLERIASDTAFQMCELEALHEVFTSLCRGIENRFMLEKETWTGVYNKSERLFDMFDTDGNGQLNFEEFARGVAVFHRDVKIKFMFDFYDLDCKGFLVRSDVDCFLKSAFAEDAKSLDAMVERTFVEADINLDGMIDLDEWRVLVNKHEAILRPLTLDALKELTIAYPEFIYHVVNYKLEEETCAA